MLQFSCVDLGSLGWALVNWEFSMLMDASKLACLNKDSIVAGYGLDKLELSMPGELLSGIWFVSHRYLPSGKYACYQILDEIKWHFYV